MVREAIKLKKIIVQMRARSHWVKTIPELINYPYLYTLNNPQNVVISPRNCRGFESILKTIKEYNYPTMEGAQ